MITKRTIRFPNIPKAHIATDKMMFANLKLCIPGFGSSFTKKIFLNKKVIFVNKKVVFHVAERLQNQRKYFEDFCYFLEITFLLISRKIVF